MNIGEKMNKIENEIKNIIDSLRDDLNKYFNNLQTIKSVPPLPPVHSVPSVNDLSVSGVSEYIDICLTCLDNIAYIDDPVLNKKQFDVMKTTIRHMEKLNQISLHFIIKLSRDRANKYKNTDITVDICKKIDEVSEKMFHLLNNRFDEEFLRNPKDLTEKELAEQFDVFEDGTVLKI